LAAGTDFITATPGAIKQKKRSVPETLRNPLFSMAGQAAFAVTVTHNTRANQPVISL
jgi:hypothetical protein